MTTINQRSRLKRGYSKKKKGYCMWSILCSISKELFSVEEYVQSILQFDAVLRRFFFKTRNRCFSLKKMAARGCGIFFSHIV